MIKIKNKELELFLQVMLKKDINRMEQKDLDNINDITLNATDELGKVISYNLDDLKLFRKLQTCTVRNYEITKENYHSLNCINNMNGINEIKMYNCNFEKDIVLELKAKTIQFISCNNLNIGNLITKSSVETIKVLHCLNYSVGNLGNTKNIYFDENDIIKVTIKDLLNSKLINITFNNCDFKAFSPKYLLELNQQKNVVISSNNRII